MFYVDVEHEMVSLASTFKLETQLEGPKSRPHVARVRSAEVCGVNGTVFPTWRAVEITRLMRLAFPDCKSHVTSYQRPQGYVLRWC